MRPKYEMEALSLHEAVPGHHLQIALATELGKRAAVPHVTAASRPTSKAGPSMPRASATSWAATRTRTRKFGQLTYEMWRAVRLVVDTGMHHKQWTREQAIDFFKENTAKTELDIVNEVDRYIAWPGQALAYKIGELKIRELRAKPRSSSARSSTSASSTTWCCGNGAVPLDVLEQMVDEWLKEKG